MVNDIITAVAISLKEFEGVTVYTEAVRQNMEQPCFIVDLVDSQYAKSAVNIRTTRPTISIVYMGLSQDDVRGVAARLPYVAERVLYNGGAWIGRNISIVPDNEAHTLVCTVSYAEQMVKPETKTKMLTYSQTQKARG